MPNYCEGTLKIRGKKENIISFLENGTSLSEGYSFPDGIVPKIKFDDDEDDEIEIKNVSREVNCLYIKGTRRSFIQPITNYIYVYNTEKDEKIVCLDYFKTAWKIDVDELKAISSKYNIDIKIYGFERGMEFNQDIEITKGKIIKDEKIEFKNYLWECINPNLGG